MDCCPKSVRTGKPSLSLAGRILPRRTFMQQLGAGGLLLCTACNSPHSTTKLLSSITDTIIPRDEHPGALDLQLDLKLQQLRKASPESYADLTALETHIQNQALTTHQQSFNSLEVSQREALLLRLLEQPRHAQHRGLQRIRSLLLRWYYGSAAGHASLAYTAPYSHPLLNTVQRAPAA